MALQIEWNEEYLKQLIDQKITESLTLEFKQCAALRENGYVYNNKSQKYVERHKTQSKDKIITEMSKDVSSFANSAGGTIIYGIIEDGHVPLDLDRYPFLPDEITKEWFENIIDSNIRPKIPELMIHPIETSGANQNGVLFAVEIPQSMIAPHQAKDYRYYQRFNFKAQPMEDYQVRDVMNRYVHPLIEAEIYYRDLSIESDEHRYSLGLKIKNIGNVTANYFGVDIHFPKTFFDRENFEEIISERRKDYGIFITEEYVKDNRDTYFKICYRSLGRDIILFPSESLTMLDPDRDYGINYIINRHNLHSLKLQKVKLLLYADSMPPKRVEFKLYDKFWFQYLSIILRFGCFFFKNEIIQNDWRQ